MMSNPAGLSEDKNWRNAGNWHWVTKDAVPFAKQYLTDHLIQIEIDQNDIKVAVNEVENIDGDCELNVRKGKLITIYDLTLTLKWTATSHGPNRPPINCTGTISIPEISHDLLSDSDTDLVLNITIDNDTHAKDPVRQVLRTHMRRPILKVLHAFPKALIESQADGVYIENAVQSANLPKADLEERKRLAQSLDHSLSFANTFSVEQRMAKKSGGATPPSQMKPTATNSKPSGLIDDKLATTTTTKLPITSTKNQDSANPTTTVLRTWTLHCSVQDAKQCFEELSKLKHWTQGQCVLDKDHWSIFDHQVSAVLVPQNEDSVLSLNEWRLRAWPAHVKSLAVLSFSSTGDGTKVSVKHSGVPVSDMPHVEQHWTQVFNRIKMTFGYGTFL